MQHARGKEKDANGDVLRSLSSLSSAQMASSAKSSAPPANSPAPPAAGTQTTATTEKPSGFPFKLHSEFNAYAAQRAIFGGVVLGACSSYLLYANGYITGISGFLNRTIQFLPTMLRGRKRFQALIPPVATPSPLATARVVPKSVFVQPSATATQAVAPVNVAEPKHVHNNEIGATGFISGLLTSGLVTAMAAPSVVAHAASYGPALGVTVPAAIVGGALVGFGTRMGNGCTSGHGLCGIARFSPRSIVASGTFLTTGVATSSFIHRGATDTAAAAAAAASASSSASSSPSAASSAAVDAANASASAAASSSSSSLPSPSSSGFLTNGLEQLKMWLASVTDPLFGADATVLQNLAAWTLPPQVMPIVVCALGGELLLQSFRFGADFQDLKCAWRVTLSSFIFGGFFGAGLGIAGMLDPVKVLTFLNPLGPAGWDPSLMLVLLSGVGVNALFFPKIYKKCVSPVYVDKFQTPPNKFHIDGALIGGAGLFGVGWGLTGLCPGPMVTGLAAGNTTFLLAFLSMICGSQAYRLLHHFLHRGAITAATATTSAAVTAATSATAATTTAAAAGAANAAAKNATAGVAAAAAKAAEKASK